MTRHTQEAPDREAGTARPTTAARPRSPQGRAADRLGLSGGGAALRRRGSLLRRLLAMGDWGALIGALCFATAVTPATDVAMLFWATLFSPVWILVVKLHGLYDNDHRRIRHSTLDELPSLISTSALGTIALDGLLALSPVGPLSAGSAIIVAGGTLVGSVAVRGVVRFFWHRLTGTAIGLMIGTPEAADIVARRLSTHPEARLHLVGYLSPPGEETATELTRLGSVDDFTRVAREHNVERVVVTEQGSSEPLAERLIEECKTAGLGLTFLPQHFGLLGPGIELNRLAELPVLDFRFSDPPRSTIAMKRGMDLVVSGTLLALLSPLLLIAALMIAFDTGFPVFFRQRRVGRDGRLFTMLKFRTMVRGADEHLEELINLEELEEPVFKIHNDPRITRSGRILRRTSVDELPQLLNVLKGDMSLVGPRPEEEAVAALYDERQRSRLAVKPGLTGPMQVYGRADLTFEERLAIERDYLDNLSITGDLALLLRTPSAIIRGDGAY